MNEYQNGIWDIRLTSISNVYIARVDQLKALIVDYGGVLTNPLADAMGNWMRADGIDVTRFRSLMREWLAAGAAGNIAHDLEAGRLSPESFERQLAAQLPRADGSTPQADGLLSRMFAGFQADLGMVGVVRRARQAGIRTGLLSNSWGFDYPRDGWAELFDDVVISGEVGMRKPDPEIYLHASARLGVPPQACVFVDDLRPNVLAAARLGMVGIHHTSVESTADELEILFGLSLR